MSFPYKLTAEGTEYLEKGLPERKLVELLKQEPSKFVKMEEIIKRVKNFSVALNWALENRWVEKKGNGVFLKNIPQDFPVEDALRKTSKGQQIPEEMLNVLLQRKLIEKINLEGEKFVKEIEGKKLNELTPELLKTGLWKKVKFARYDVNVPPKKIIQTGKIQPYRQVIEEIRERLIGMGFVEARGPLVELGFWNNDALFMPQDHPARGIHDIFFTKNLGTGKVLDKGMWERVGQTHKDGWITGSSGWGAWDFPLARKLILRSQGTAVSARTLYKLKKEELPHKMFLIDRVFRPDVLDAKHLAEFDQCEGIVVGEGLTLTHLLGYLKEIAMSVTGAEKVRFKPSYFPFTEPSVEGQAYHPKLGWFEFGGAGIFRPEVTLPLGIEVPVLAWGLGLGRLAMVRLKVDDIRYLYSDDLQWLRSKEVVR